VGPSHFEADSLSRSTYAFVTTPRQHYTEYNSRRRILFFNSVRNNDNMSSSSQRVSTGIDSLVRRLLVEIPGEDPASHEDRELNAVEFVREVLER
jgi:hypothetical protein